jgi:hypothetical protein
MTTCHTGGFVSALARRRKLKPVHKSDRMTRSLRALERTASTSRVLNLLAIEAESTHRPEYGQAPMFRNRVLNTALVVKHRLRNDDIFLFDEAGPPPPRSSSRSTAATWAWAASRSSWGSAAGPTCCARPATTTRT